MKELSKTDIALIAFAVVVMVAIYFFYPYTPLGKQLYAEQRQNAINYIYATSSILSTDKNYQKEVSRLVRKYHLEDIYGENWTQQTAKEAMLDEFR